MVNRPLRVLVVEDHALLARTWLKALRARGHLAETTDAVAGAKEALLNALRQKQSYHVVVLDLVLTDGDGLQLLGFLKGIAPPPAVAVVSANIDAACALQLQRLEVRFLPKPAGLDVVIALVEDLRRRADTDHIATFCGECSLTQTEAEIVRRAAHGTPNRRIDEQLGHTEEAGRTYWKRIRQKTGCDSQRDVMAALFRHTRDGSKR